MMKLIIFTYISVILGACAPTKEIAGPYEQMRSEFNLERAVKDADDAFGNGDFRFLAIQGYTQEIPGVNLSPGEQQKFGIRVVDKSTDSYENEQAQARSKQIRKYTALYNREMAKKIGIPVYDR